MILTQSGTFSGLITVQPRYKWALFGGVLSMTRKIQCYIKLYHFEPLHLKMTPGNVAMADNNFGLYCPTFILFVLCLPRKSWGSCTGKGCLSLSAAAAVIELDRWFKGISFLFLSFFSWLSGQGLKMSCVSFRQTPAMCLPCNYCKTSLLLILALRPTPFTAHIGLFLHICVLLTTWLQTSMHEATGRNTTPNVHVN